jgi:EAL domain-containing protein (putative c-di-GMP-specific phosphodiesterase class I)
VKQLLHIRKDLNAETYGTIPLLERIIDDVLHEYGIPAELLELEMTESGLMSHAARTLGQLQGLRSRGVQISIDDFGTGYSSLAYLKRFTVNSIKIDQAFVRDITTDVEDAAIILAIISLAHSLKLGVVAEGVETREQMEFLRAHGCDKAQGYLMARPMPADGIAALFAKSRCWEG